MGNWHLLISDEFRFDLIKGFVLTHVHVSCGEGERRVPECVLSTVKIEAEVCLCGVSIFSMRDW